MVSTNPPSPKGAKVRVSPNPLYPTANATFLRTNVGDLVEVRVVDGEHEGKVWVVHRKYVRLISGAPLNVKAGTPNSLPDSQDGVEVFPDNDSDNASEVDVTRVMPWGEDEPPTPDAQKFMPGVTPRRLRKALGARNGKTEGCPKGFQRPILRSQKLDAIKRLGEQRDANTQKIDEGLRAHLDWLQGTGVVSHPQRLLQYLSDVLDEDVFFEPSRPWVMGRTYLSSGRCVNGFRIGFSPRKDKGGAEWDVLVVFSGSVMAEKSLRHWRKVCRGLRRLMGFVPTRIDVALDDYDKTLDPKLFRDAIAAGNIAGFNAKGKGSGFIDGGDGGWTVNMGSRSSESFMRLYEKEVESKGKLPCYRLEVELKRSLAVQALDGLLAIPLKEFEAESPKYLGGLVVGRYNFIDRTSKPGEKNVTRIPRLDWWQKFIDRVGKEVRHDRIRKDWSVERMTRWLNHQVVTALATIREALGEETFFNWLMEKLDYAKANKMKAWHWHRVQKFRDEIRLFASV